MYTTKSLVTAFAIAASFGTASANCDVGKCIGSIVSKGVAAAGICAAAAVGEGENGSADIQCVKAIEKTVVAGLENCGQCAIANPCNTNDSVASQRGCSQLGPNHCMQLSSSVPRPSKTDKRVGDYTFHCHNSGLIVDSTGTTCYWPCSQCSQCAGVPSSKRELEEVMFEA